MELQSRAEEFARANTAVFAISYDPVEVLAGFARQHGITFRLLSDEGSRVISELGLLNRHVAEQQAAAGRPVEPHHAGIPYPGMFVLNEDGVIVDKQFEQTHQPRPAPDLILEELLGVDALKHGVSATAEGSGVRATAWMATGTYRPMQRLHLHVALDIGAGLHIYAEPAPEGMRPLRIRVASTEGVRAEAADLPETRIMELPSGLDATELVPVYEGAVRAAALLQIDANRGEVPIDLEVEYQACTDTTCYPPELLRLELRLQGLDNVRPEPAA